MPFVVRVDRIVSEARATCVEVAICFLSNTFFKKTGKLNTLVLVQFRENHNIGILWLFVDALPVDRIVNFRSCFQSFFEAEIVVTVLERVKTYVFELFFKQLKLLGLLLQIRRLYALV